MTPFERLAACERRLKERGASLGHVTWGEIQGKTREMLAEDLAITLEAYLDGKYTAMRTRPHKRWHTTEWQWSGAARSGWFRLFGYGLTFRLYGKLRFSERQGYTRYLKIGPLIITGLGPRVMYFTPAGDEKS